MIICSRCGKENQDQYTFCFVCGAELKHAGVPSAALASPVPAASGTPAPAPLAPAALPAEPRVPARDPLPIEMARTAVPPDPNATPAPENHGPALLAKKKSGIPWNDSPKPPQPFGPGFGAAPASLPSVVVSGSIGSGDVSGPVPVESGPSGASAGVCPSCGKPVKPGYAFCGSCGARLTTGSSAKSGTPLRQPTASAIPAAAPLPRGRLVLIRPDGSEGATHPLHDGVNLIGRGQGTLFDQDAYLSPRHAEFTLASDGLLIRDLRSLNGVFVKITKEEELQSADVFRIGQELLRFDVIAPPSPLEDGTEVAGTPNPGFWGRLSVIVSRDVDGSAFPLFGDAVVLGRERGDILFPEDGYVSGTHARIGLREGRVFLSDLGSSNGSFLKIRGERTVPAGSFILMGQQLFRIEFR